MSYRVTATVVVFDGNQLVIPAQQEEGSSVQNIVQNVRARYFHRFGHRTDVRLSDIRDVQIHHF